MNLTAKQEAFSQNVAKGMTQSDAYRNAYNAENMADETLWVKACELAKQDNVSVRIEELKKEVSLSMRYDREAHFKKLEMLHNLALTPSGENGTVDLNNAIKATVEQGKVCGLYIDKVESKVEFVDKLPEGLTKDELLKIANIKP